METLKEAKQLLRENWEKGIDCPCCTQYVKLYKRPFNAGMAYSLILIFRLSRGTKWIHVQNEFADKFKLNANRMDYSQLERWGLIEQHYGVRDDGSKRVGLWKITEKGIDFVNKRITIRKRVHLFNDKTYGFSGDRISIVDALGKKFDYNELMSNE